MKQKNYKWLFYFGLLLLIGAILFLSLKEVSPLSRQVEKEISVNLS